ncbi:MAG: hypothetical protein ACFFE4_06855 [Candidatus Thorarchaeota archaeon]
MKKISYSLRIGIVGKKDYNSMIFIDDIKNYAVNVKSSESNVEFLVVVNNIPIKVKAFLIESLNDIIEKFDEIENLDVIILTVNLFEPNSIYQYQKDIFEEFNEVYDFQGISILIGLDLDQIFKNTPSKDQRISRYNLEEITRYLKIIYCFEIYNKNKDIIRIYKKIFEDFLFRFRYSGPELFEQAQVYGESLIKQYSGQLKQF